MEQLIGKVLHSRYQIDDLLGRQTGRRTFLATDQQTEAAVVVKLLLFGPDFTWEDLKLFEREAEVLKALSHSAIPKYLNSFEVETDLGKGFALVQTYIPARSLQDALKSGGTFNEADLRAIAKQLLEILSYLHDRQPPVIHRDIKPSNILLSDRTPHSLGKIYLVDFGSVQTITHAGTRTVVGTYGYMPPEQFGGRTTPAADLYALGATLIYLATGQDPDKLLQQSLKLDFEESVSLSPELVDWLKWMTEPDVNLRLKSARQALKALETSRLHPRSLSKSSTTDLHKATTRPADSRVRLTKTRQFFEIVIPPQGFHLALIPIVVFAVVWNSFLVMWYSIAISMWSSGGWFAALFAIGHLGIGLGGIGAILFMLLGKVKLQITPATISLRHEILGVKCRPLLTANRKNIMKLELTRLSYKLDSDGDRISVPPAINIWAGTKQFTLGSQNTLTPPELEWLVEELSQWLELPIARPE